MPEETRPALTPEEWKEFRESRAEAAFAIMALANAQLPDDDPRKITHEDVRELHERAANDPIGVDDNGDDIPDPPLTLIADKLAALLPPLE